LTEAPSADPVARFLASRVAEGRMPGATWWIGRAHEQALRRGAVGQATVEPRRETLDVATPFDLASLTKPLVTAPLLLLLAREGRVDLEGPVGGILPELARSPAGRASLATLARHGAGLPAWAPLFVENTDREAYLRAIAALPPVVSPGGVLYSDLGYILLGAAIERAASVTLDRLFAERSADPLGLRRTGFATGGRSFADAAATEHGNAYERILAGAAGAEYAWRMRVIRGAVHDANAHGLSGVAGHAGLFGPVDEVARLAGELLDPRILPFDAASHARLVGRPVLGRTIGFVTADRAEAACGILPDDAPGHTGFTGTSVWLDPRRRGVYVLLTHRVHPRVDGRRFSPVRRGFHRLARRALERA
jgi:CubicO group peptidase (beta-lactamase class C family)